jgi:hypothetical protein
MILNRTLSANYSQPILLLTLLLFLPGLHAAETTLSLDTARVCNYTLAYEDKGSGGDQDVSIYTPKVPTGYYIIGGYAQGDYDRPSGCVLAAKPSSSSTGKAGELLVQPATWQLVWADKGTGAIMDGSVWHPVPPNSNYVCIGSVGQTGYGKPAIPNYRCLHKCLVENVNAANYLWSDKGTGSDNKISMYKLSNSGLFYAIPDRKKPFTLVDLKAKPACYGDIDTMSVMPVEETTVKPVEAPPKKNEWVNPDLQ